MITVEVNQTEENLKNIFIKGNIVKSINEYVLVNKENICDSDCFSGQVLCVINNRYWEIGDYSNKWLKSTFTQFTGTITITSK